MKKEGATKDDVIFYAMDELGHCPEYLWAKFPSYAILRCKENNKWYAVLLDVRRDKLGLEGEGKVDLLDIKISKEDKAKYIGQKGFTYGYHFGGNNWIGILLDGSVQKNLVFSLLVKSYQLVKPKKHVKQ